VCRTIRKCRRKRLQNKAYFPFVMYVIAFVMYATGGGGGGGRGVGR
jgi:hypothetical protein